tara:strand:- start:1656 stop:1991 length:336 start_codon:yes stop_codon:yes gene_type:complete
VRREFGRDETSTPQLENMLQHYGVKDFTVGTRTDYDHHHDQGDEAPRAGIFNTDHGPPGTHWFCVYDQYVYDPLGDDHSGTQEQPEEATDCGQRCVAYIVLCEKLGHSIGF